MYIKIPSVLANEDVFKENVEKAYSNKRNREYSLEETYINIKKQIETHLSGRLPGQRRFSFDDNDGCLPVEVEFKGYTEKITEEKLREWRYFWNEKQWSVNPDGIPYEEFCKRVEENFIRDIDTCVLYATGR